MRTELLFSMDARTSAPYRVGSYLVPNRDRWDVRWTDRADDAFVSITVDGSVAEAMERKICRIHPTVRCVSTREIGPPA